MFQGLPRWLIAFGIVVIVVIEIVSRLPDIMLLPQRLAGGAGEYGGKALQPQLIETQIDKTRADAQAAATQAQLNAVQADKVAAETRVAQLQAQVVAAQADKTRADTQLAQMQTVAAAAQAEKTQAETKVAQLQQSLTVAQANQAEAQADQARAQATQTNLSNAGTILGAAIVVGSAAYAADKLGLIPHNDGTTQVNTPTTPAAEAPLQTSTSFEAGRTDWHRWHDWTVGLSGDRLAGEEFWAGIRSQKPARGCAAAPGPYSAEFQEGCEATKKYLATVDQSRLSDSDYRAGWNQGATETGD